MIPHVTEEDARRWLTMLEPDEVAHVQSSIGRGETQRGRLFLVLSQFEIAKAAYHRVMGESGATRSALHNALEVLTTLLLASDAEPKWLRIGLTDGLPIALVLKDQSRISAALECAERLMRTDRDVRDFFCAAQVFLYRDNRVEAHKYLDEALREKGNGAHWPGLLEALDGAIARDQSLFFTGVMKALKVYDLDMKRGGGRGSVSAVFFLPIAGILALSRHVNPEFSYEKMTDLRLLPDFV